MKPFHMAAAATAAVAVLGAVLILAQMPSSTAAPPQSAPIYLSDLPIPPWAKSFGSPNAPTVLIEIFDLLCPYCAEAHAQLDPLYSQLVAQGRLRLIYVDYAGHPGSDVLHTRLYCAYRQLGNETMNLISRLYQVFLRDEANAYVNELALLAPYSCRANITDFNGPVMELVKALAAKGIRLNVVGTPMYIVLKDGKAQVVVGARVNEVRQLIAG